MKQPWERENRIEIPLRWNLVEYATDHILHFVADKQQLCTMCCTVLLLCTPPAWSNIQLGSAPLHLRAVNFSLEKQKRILANVMHGMYLHFWRFSGLARLIRSMAGQHVPKQMKDFQEPGDYATLLNFSSVHQTSSRVMVCHAHGDTNALTLSSSLCAVGGWACQLGGA